MLYISYGSNMNIEQMSRRCPHTKVVGNGKLYGWKLVFNCHADIIYTGNKNDVVPVVVWELNHKTDIHNLDRYEGYPLYYTKRTIPVTMDSSGNEEQAMVYVMSKNRKGIYPPDAYYFNVIKEGYVANGIDLKLLYAAAEYSIDSDNITRYNQYNAR